MPTATALHPLSAARMDGIDISHPFDAAWIKATPDSWLGLMLPWQSVTDDQQVAFSEIFGPLETTRSAANRAGGKVIVLTNMWPDGQSVPPTDKQALKGKANQFWHHDSSFKALPAPASILSAGEIPDSGRDTAYCSMGTAWHAMPEAMQASARDRIVIHGLGWSRGRADPAVITMAERAAHPPVKRAVMHRATPFASTAERRPMVPAMASCPTSVV